MNHTKTANSFEASRDMKAMIFAAGLGTRLKPLTDTLPKALVPVLDKPLLGHVIEKVQKAGINQIVVNIHYFADKVEEWINSQDWEGKSTIAISDERKQLLETGGAIHFARELLKGCNRFLIHNVDIISNCDIEWMNSQVKEDAVASLLVCNCPTTRFLLFNPQTMQLVGWMNSESGDFLLTSPEITPSECKALSFAGIHIASERIFDLMDQYINERGLAIDPEKGTRFPIMSFYIWAAQKHPIYGIEDPKLNFIDVGKLDAIKPAEDFIRNSTT